MSTARRLDGLSARIVAAHEMLDSMRVPHQFGGAIALAWYRSPRATTDIDLNVTLAPQEAEPVLGALSYLGVSITASARALIQRDGQARLDWDGSYLDLFFATLDLHREMAARSREVEFGPVSIPILSPEHLIVCKAIFDRPKDWVDIEEIVTWGTDVDEANVMRWIDELLGADSAQHERLAELLTRSRVVPGALPLRPPPESDVEAKLALIRKAASYETGGREVDIDTMLAETEAGRLDEIEAGFAGPDRA